MADTRPTRLMEEAGFVLGRVVVTPSARMIAVGTRVAVIEPRVMQVLVTLARRRGEVVGRQTLVDACWDGRIVGDDAVNRAILKLRRALDDIGGDVTIETVAKVGYRLGIPAEIRSSPPAPGRARAARMRLAGAAALAGIAGIGLFLIGSHAARPRPRIVIVQPLHVAAGDAPARGLSQDFTSDLSRAVLGHDGALEFAADGLSTSPQGAAFAVTGSVATVGQELHAVVAVSSGGDHAILWSHDYTAPLTDVAGLRQQVSTNLAAVLVCALGTRGVPDRVDARATALYLEACNLHSGDQAQVAYLLRQVTARAPLFAGGWADLAVSLAFASAGGGDDAGAMRREADDAARRALSLDPHQGNAYYARALLLKGTRNWIARERIVKAGLTAEPDNPQLYNRLATDLAAIGRRRDSITANRRAVALDPLFPGKTAGLIRAFANAGQLDEANEAVRHMRETWPTSAYTWRAAFDTAAWLGNPREAEAMLDDPHGRPFDVGDIAAWKTFLRARSSPTRHNVDSAIAALMAARHRGTVSDAQLLSDLTLLGHPAAAVDIALRMPPQPDSDFWFRHLLQPLRADPRFMTIALQQGLLQIWRATGTWPDFCADPSLAYDCHRKGPELASRASP